MNLTRSGRHVLAWIKANPLIVALAIVAAAFFMYYYYLQPQRPTAMADPKASWNYWFDQGEYVKEARAMRAGNLDKTQYTYPLGYPMVGAALAGMTKNDPFLLFNLAVYVFVIVMAYLVVRHLLGSGWGLAAAGALMFATPLTYYTVIPWTTTATLPAVMGLLYLAFVKEKLTYTNGGLLALALVLAYMARGGGEMVLFTPLALAVLWKFRSQTGVVKPLALMATIFATGVIGNALWTKAIFGTWIHPYINIVAHIGFNPRRIPRSFWGTVFYSGRTGEFFPPLLASAAWFVFAPVGMVLAVWRDKLRWLHAGLIASLILGFAVTTSYNEYSAATLKTNGLHYLKIWFPALTLYSLWAVKAAFDWQKSRLN